jgi:hypothetical protein
MFYGWPGVPVKCFIVAHVFQRKVLLLFWFRCDVLLPPCVGSNYDLLNLAAGLVARRSWLLLCLFR